MSEKEAELSDSDEEVEFVETEEDLGSSSEMKSGFLQRKIPGKKKIPFIYFALSGSTLYAYKDKQEQTPKKSYELRDAVLEDSSFRPFAFQIKKGGKEILILIGTSKQDAENWKAAITASLSKEPGPAPVKEKVAKRRVSIAMQAKKKVGGKIVTSAAGKKAVRTAIPEETRLLLVALKRMIAKCEGQKKAEEIEDNIMKLILKAFILERDKQITLDDFLVADAPLREAFELLIQIRDYRDRMRIEVMRGKIEKVSQYLQQVEKHLTDMLNGKLQPNSIRKLAITFGLLSSIEFLEVFCLGPGMLNSKGEEFDASLDEERDMLSDAMNRYTQFNF